MGGWFLILLVVFGVICCWYNRDNPRRCFVGVSLIISFGIIYFIICLNLIGIMNNECVKSFESLFMAIPAAFMMAILPYLSKEDVPVYYSFVAGVIFLFIAMISWECFQMKGLYDSFVGMFLGSFVRGIEECLKECARCKCRKNLR